MLTLDDWARRFAPAAQLIAARLETPPSLEELARAAALSPYHFHRAWRALTGETVAQTVLRVRLEASRELLKASSVTEAALAVGFATPQSFARAFRRRFDESPSEYRQSQPGGAEVVVEQRERTMVVALRHLGAYRELNATFAALWVHAEAAGMLGSLRGIYGVLYDDPANVPTARLRYDACLALDLAPVPLPFERRELPAGRAARLRHTGSYSALEQRTQWLCGEWLLTSGYEPGGFPVFHQYLNDPDQTPEDQLQTDIVLLLAER